MRPRSSPSEGEEGRAPHFVQSLERGLAVIRAFDLSSTKPDWALAYRFDIVLCGPEATPFE